MVQDGSEPSSKASPEPGPQPAASKSAARGRRVLPWGAQILICLALLGGATAASGVGGPMLGRALDGLGLPTLGLDAEPEAPAEAGDARRGGGAQGGRGGRAGRAAPPVILAEAVAARDDIRLELTGGAIAHRTATLRARAEGRVTAVTFEAGDALEADQALLTLEDRRERLAVARAKAALDEAKRQKARALELQESGAVSEAASDAAETAAEIARITLAEAEEALADRTVRAPFAGVVSLPLVEIGDRITPADPIATLDDRTSLLVEVEAPETAFGRLRIDLPVIASTVAYPGERFEGRLAEIDSRLDPAARAAAVRAEIPNAEDRLRPGMSFVLRFDLPGAPAIAVPELALQWERDGAYVWRVREGAAERAPVRLVARDGGRALVRAVEEADPPLAPGDRIVVEGVQRLREGGRVRALNGPDGAGRRAGRTSSERPR